MQLAKALYRADNELACGELAFGPQAEYVARAFDVQLAALRDEIGRLKSRQHRAETRREEA